MGHPGRSDVRDGETSPSVSLDDDYQVIDGEGTPESRQAGWAVGFGLQAVDGLEPTDYAREIADKNVSGEYTYIRAAAELVAYHAANPTDGRALEADLVSARISQLLQDPSFTLAPTQLFGIHARLFTGVLPDEWVGVARRENISKPESVLGGASVVYTDCGMIEATLKYDFEQERGRQPSYRHMDGTAVSDAVAGFIAGVWQIHPFREGNTRTCAVFAIQYLRTLGFHMDNRPFERDAKRFRDALALANGDRSRRDDEPLRKFLRQVAMPD